jgi:hypothetical protein
LDSGSGPGCQNVALAAAGAGFVAAFCCATRPAQIQEIFIFCNNVTIKRRNNIIVDMSDSNQGENTLLEKGVSSRFVVLHCCPENWKHLRARGAEFFAIPLHDKMRS